MTIPDLRRVLTEVKGSLVSQYMSLFAYSGVEIRFTSAALDEICKKAFERGGGARGLRGIMVSSFHWLSGSVADGLVPMAGIPLTRPHVRSTVSTVQRVLPGVWCINQFYVPEDLWVIYSNLTFHTVLIEPLKGYLPCAYHGWHSQRCLSSRILAERTSSAILGGLGYRRRELCEGKIMTMVNIFTMRFREHFSSWSHMYYLHKICSNSSMVLL